MIAFYILIFLVFCSTFLNRYKQQQHILIFISCLISMFLLGLRAPTTGVDTQTYYEIYNIANTSYKDIYVHERLEPIYIMMNQLFGFFFTSPVFFVFIMAVLAVGSISFFFKKYSVNLGLSWLVFLGYSFYFQFFNVMRQSIALSILLLSIPFILKRKLLSFTAIIVIAFGFHNTALLFWPVYFIYGRKINIRILSLLWLVSLAFVFDNTLVHKVLNSVAFIVPPRYINFLEDDRLIEFGAQGLGIKLFFLQAVFVLLLFSYSKISKWTDNKTQSEAPMFFIVVGLFGILLMNLFYQIGLVNRLVTYFLFFIGLGLPIAINLLFKGNQRNIILLLASSAFILLFFRGVATGSSGVFPYSSIIPSLI